MSKIKPDTHLPLFGVETEYPPGVRYWISGLFSMYNEDTATAGLGLQSADVRTIPNGDDVGAASLGLVSVEALEIIPPNNISIDQDVATSGLSLINVEALGVDTRPSDVAANTLGLQAVDLPSVLMDTYDVAATALGLQAVEIE